MWSEKFLNIIERSPIGALIENQRRALEEIDPRRIYPENIRSFFHIPLRLAIWLCEAAVFEGLFEKHVAYLCPNDDCRRILADASKGEMPSEPLCCQNCEALERERHCFTVGDCRKITFYRLPEKDLVE
jgi:hypothetical protein